MFSTIVVAFDESASAYDALTLASGLAADSAQLVVVCGYPVGVLSARIAPPEHGAAGRGDAQRRLEAARVALDGRANVRLVAQPARSAAAAVHAVAEEVQADLLVVGSSHRGPVGRVLPGATAAQVLHAAPCAVAIAPTGLRDAGRLALRRIGVGIDGGPEARRALVVAAELAAERHTRLDAIRVIEPVDVVFGPTGAWMYPEYREDAIASAETDLDEAIAQLPAGAPVVGREILDGSPAEELLRASERLDLLVLGSRGYGPLGRLLVGSVSTRVLASAACPMLLVARAD